MTILGMPEAMFLVFVATLLAGSLAAIHYTIVYVILDRAGDSSVQSTGGKDLQ
jgi:hypothetical protein